jgi:hypothetical protein
MAVLPKRRADGSPRKAPAARRREARQIGPNIVRAWFDSVINPLLRSLETERELLQKGNWTWRFRPAGLEGIRSSRVYIQPYAWDNLKQFAVLNPAARKAIDLHDARVLPLAEQCRQFHEAVRAEQSLLDLYRRTTSPESLSELNVRDTHYLFGGYPEADHLDVLAEYIVNNTGELPLSYGPAPLWNKHKAEFLKLRDHPAVQGRCESTAAAGEALLKSVNRLIRLLEEKRLQLSLDYDQPYIVDARQA